MGHLADQVKAFISARFQLLTVSEAGALAKASSKLELPYSRASDTLFD